MRKALYVLRRGWLRCQRSWVWVFDIDRAFSTEQVAERCDFPRKQNAGSAERRAKTPSTLVGT